MTVITLTPNAAGSPSPFVQVDIDGAPTAAATLTAWRSAKGREFKVRGMVSVPVDGASVQDFEAPPGYDLRYRVEFFDSSGSFIGWSDAVTTSMPEMGNAKAWFHNVLDPTTAVQVTELRAAANSLNRSTPADRFTIPGRSVAVILPGDRGGLSGVQLDCVTLTIEDADRLDAMFGGYDDDTVAVLCVRTPAVMRLPAPLYAFVGDPSQIPLDTHQGKSSIRWVLPADEVAPPAEALVVPLLSYADFTAFYLAFGAGDYAGFTSSYSDYTEASRDYTIAGTV